MMKYELSDILYFLEIKKLADAKGFNFRSEHNILYVRFPYNTEHDEVEIKNIEDMIEICKEITLWK